MNDIKKLLPIGSVVLLENGQKRLMIIGVKQTDVKDDTEYDYLSVLYPEGYLNPETSFFFNHDAIAEVCFEGLHDEEREEFLDKLDAFYTENDDEINRTGADSDILV